MDILIFIIVALKPVCKSSRNGMLGRLTQKHIR